MTPGARLWSFKVFDITNTTSGKCEGSTSDIISALKEIHDVYSEQIDVVNLSLETLCQIVNGTDTCLPYEGAINKLIQKGIPVVATCW